MKDFNQILDWIQEKGIKTNKNQKIEFNDHNCLLDFLLDNGNRIVVQKPTQVGATFTALLKILFLADGDAISIIYTMPTAPEARDLVVSKFDPIIERAPGLRSKVQRVPFTARPVWSSVLKRIGESYFFFRGSWVSWRAQQIDADVLVVDELDFQKPEIRAMYEERLEGSGSRDIIYWLGYPSIPNYGISDLYQKSDQREWWIKCPLCLQEQILEWPQSINIQKKIFNCKFCKKELPDLARKRGVWKAKFPGRPIHGYAISKLMAPWISAARIIKSFQEDSPKHFHNYTLGLPYQETKNELTDEIISNGKISDQLWETLKTEHVICGVDQGDQFHFVAGVASPSGPIVTAIELLKSPKELEDRLEYYKPELTVIDMMPDKHIAKLIQMKYGLDKIFLGNLRNWGEVSTSMKGHIEVKRGSGIVNIERTESFDFLFEAIKDSTMKFKSNISYFEALVQHLKNLIPDYVERYGTVKKVWKNVGRDDYAHALNYFYTAYQILYPTTELLQTELVPSASSINPIPGTPEWLSEDFDKRVRKLANPEGVIVIPPKNLKT